MGEDTEPRLGVSWAQVAGSALAAVSSAVLLSTLGVAGTVIGAAVGSVAATIGTAVYTRTLDVSREQVAAQAAALRRVTRARRELDEAVAARSRGDVAADTGITRAGRELDEAEEVLAATGADPAAQPAPDDEADSSDVRRAGWLSQLRAAGWPAQLSWRRLGVAAAAVFLVAMGVITAFELTTGRAVSGYTGGSDRQTGSTIPGLGRTEDNRTPTPSDSPSPGATTDGAEEDGDRVDPDASGSAAPSEDPTGVPTAEPSETEDAPPSPTLTATPSPSPDVTLTPSSTPAG